MAESSAHEPLTREVVIQRPEGLHMRPAMEFVRRSTEYKSHVTITKGDQTINGKSIMQLTMLAATCGTKLLLTVKGEDAAEAMASLVPLLETPESEANISDCKPSGPIDER